MTAIPLRHIEGKYEILEKLREGGMGAIYKVRHRLLDEIRVIKLMRQQLVGDDELKARFLREARLAIKLRHPNIAQLYDFTVDDDGTAFIVMEFIDGVTLEDMLASHPPPTLGFALEIAQQSLKALGYFHSRGFIHRDISPDNLMLTADAEDQPLVKLIDLGIVKTLDAGGDSHLTQTGTFLGKIRYAPPEQFGADGAATVDARGDLYSLGIVLYQLLTGRFPIQGRDPSSLIAGHLFRPPLDFAESDPEGRVPAGLREVVLKAIAKKPEDRFASAQELSRTLAGFRSSFSDWTQEELKKLLSRPYVLAEASETSLTGSTQGRLDQQFDLKPTPAPGSLLILPAPAPAPTAVFRQPDAEEGKARELAAAVAAIETALDSKDYRMAEALLYGAEANFGQQEAFAPLYERIAVESEAERKRSEEMAALKAAVRDRTLRQDFKGALRELRRAGPLDPEGSEVATLKEEVETASRERTEAKRREQQKARDLKKIQDRLAKGDLDGAGELLDKAAALHGEEAAEPLREQLNELRRAERRAQALNAALAEIRDRLDHGDLDAAGDLLDRAVLRFRAIEPLREQWERLEQMRRAAKAESQAVAVHLAEARRLAAGQRFDAALEELGRAASLSPGSPEVAALRKEMSTGLRRQKDARRREGELALATATIEVQLDRAALATAAELLESARAVHGDAEPLVRLQARLEGLRRQAKARLVPAAPAPAPAAALAGSGPDEFWEATQRIADLLSRREPQQALQELQSATSRFGDRAELLDLRKRIAARLLDD